jgi:D-tyrosyl-tRNA(Tyr) deacylase
VRVVVQRVTRAAVRRLDGGAADAATADEAHIGAGLVLLAGFTATDDAAVLEWMAAKCLGLRLFPDAEGAMNRSVEDIGGSLLVVPNFTLYGDAAKGRRPGFSAAAPPEIASRHFDAFVTLLRRGPVPVAAGFFRSHMHVELVNDGPVTLIVEREARDA